MTSPTWHFDGARRRIYEVPPGAAYTVDGQGYRHYDGGDLAPPLLSAVVQSDLWSRWVDYQAANDWALLAFRKYGGNLRPTGGYATADFELLTSDGWRIVLADYRHTTILRGNLFAEGQDDLFDIDRLTAVAVPVVMGADALLTFSSDPSAVADAVWAHSQAVRMADMLAEAWGRLGLDPARPLVQDNASISFGSVLMALTEAAGAVTVTRA